METRKDHQWKGFYLVEREPMWDGNPEGANGTPKPASQLSENQCGMETIIMRQVPPYFLLVEREPMWDGNRDNL